MVNWKSFAVYYIWYSNNKAQEIPPSYLKVSELIIGFLKFKYQFEINIWMVMHRFS